MNIVKELKRESAKLQMQYKAARMEIERIDKLLSLQLTTPREKRKELIREYWRFLDNVEESNPGDIRQWTRESIYRETFNDPPPPQVLGQHDPYNYVESVKQRLRGLRNDRGGDCKRYLIEIAELEAKRQSIKGNRPWARFAWLLLAAAVGAALATVARLLIN